MAKGLKIEVTGMDAFNLSDRVVYEAVRDCMDDIKDDVLAVSKSLAPKKTGKLESSARTRKKYVNLESCSFSITFKGNNKGFDYATWTHDKDYKLGVGSMAKQPKKSRFAKGTLRVGKGYMSQVIESSDKEWLRFISQNVDRKLKASIKAKRSSKKTY